MKCRDGFVSNSSSCSFVVAIPKNFNIKKFIESTFIEDKKSGLWRLPDGHFEYSDLPYTTVEKKDLMDAIHTLQKCETFYEESDPKLFRIVHNALKHFTFTVYEPWNEKGNGRIVGLDIEEMESKLKLIRKKTDENA